MAIIEIDKLCRVFGPVHALRDIDLKIERAEWLAVMGPSGSGKSTLLNILAGLDRPDSGRVLVDGTDMTGMGEDELSRFRREKIGLVFQQFHLISYLNALENVMLAEYFHSLADEDEARRALERVGLADRMTHRPSQLSGGEQQRLCIARALINHPAVLLADEPTGSLDAQNQDLVLDLFRDLHREGRTIVMVTHDMRVGRLADRRLELSHGAILGVQRLPRETEEMFDEILQQLWEAQERQGGDCSDSSTLMGNTAILKTMLDNGLIRQEPAGYAMSARGEARAKDIIRRHRLAECLFQSTLKLKGEEIEPNACVFEHVISPEVEQGICCLLGHPGTCPHGRLIPGGHCCEGSK